MMFSNLKNPHRQHQIGIDRDGIELTLCSCPAPLCSTTSKLEHFGVALEVLS